MDYLVTDMRYLINQDNQPKLRELLHYHLNKNARKQKDIFTNYYPNQRDNLPQEPESYTCLSHRFILSIVYTFAPLEVCQAVTSLLLTLSDADFAEKLNAIFYKASGHEERILFIIMHTAPTANRLLLLERIGQLSDEYIVNLLFNETPNYRKFNQFLELFNKTDRSSAYRLVEAFAKINDQLRLDLCQTSYFPYTSHLAFIHFFQDHVNEKLALSMLAILNRYQGEDLKKLVYNAHESFNLLHPIFHWHSENVVRAFLMILKNLDKETYKTCLLSHSSKNYDHTPIELAFQRQQKPMIGLMIAKELEADTALKSLLTWVSSRQPLSPIHYATTIGNVPIIRYFLEQSTIDTEHFTYLSKQTMFDLATQHHHQTLITLFNTNRLVNLIKSNTSNHNNQQFLKEFAQTIDKNPAVLTYQKTNGSTLIHDAVMAHHLPLTKLLLQKGSPRNVLDVTENNPLTIALKNNDFAIIQLLMTTSPDLLTMASHALQQLPVVTTSYHVLQEIFQEKNQLSIDQFIEQYAIQNQDGLIFFIIKIASYLKESPQELLQENTRFFLQKWLELLIKNSDYSLENALQLPLICFIFLLNPMAVDGLLKATSFDVAMQEQLGLVLLRALIQPAIIMQLSLSTHRYYVNLLGQLSPVNHNLVQSLATLHFNNTSLLLLTPELLQQFARLLPRETLIAINKKRRTIGLLILTLTNILTPPIADMLVIDDYINQLHDELIVFNNVNCAFDEMELLQAFNMACLPELKQILTKALNQLGTKSILVGRLKRLFSVFNHQQTLTVDGFLRQWFITIANDVIQLSLKEHLRALTELLMITTHQETITILNTLQQYVIKPHYKLKAWVSPLTITTSSDDDRLRLSHWLLSLISKKERFLLIPFIEKIDYLADTLDENLSILQSNAANTSIIVNDAILLLKNLLSQLKSLGTQMFAIHLSLADTAWTSDIQNQLAVLEKNIVTVCQMQNKHLDTLPVNHAIFNKLQDLLDITDLLTCLKDTCQKIDQQPADITDIMVLTNHPNYLPLQLVFEPLSQTDYLFAQKDAIFSSVAKFNADSNESIQPIVTQVITSLLANKQLYTDINQVLPWLVLGLTGNDAADLYKILATLVSNVHLLYDLTAINKRFKKQITLIINTTPVLLCIYSLVLTETVSLASLMSLLYELENSILLQLRELTLDAHAYDLLALVDYIVALKKSLLPINCILSTSLFPEQNSRQWLDHVYQTLTDYTSSVMSIILIIDGIHLIHATDAQVNARLLAILLLAKDHGKLFSVDALLCIIISYEPILKSQLTIANRQLVIQVIHALLNACKLDKINQIINALPASVLHTIIDRCLKGLSSDESSSAQACQQVLTLISQYHTANDTTRMTLIKEQLGYQDLNLLTCNTLLTIAQQILAKSEQLPTATQNGIWLQRLLSSPHFIAACDTTLIQALLARYRLISLTLKQTEFEQLSRYIADNVASYHHQLKNLSEQLSNDLPSYHAQRNRLLEKRQRLLQFRADDSIRALLINLENNCHQLKKTHPDIADVALDQLFGYYSQALSGLRADILFQMSDYIYDKLTASSGDINLAKKSVLGWLAAYLPKKNFEQKELVRKNTVRLYNEQGNQIAYVNESNHVLTVVDNEPWPIIDSQCGHLGMPFYDENRRLVGWLTSNGQLKQDTIFQENTSALLLAKVPITQLTTSPTALGLLICDVFNEQSLDTLYLNSDSSRHSWLEQQVHDYLVSHDKPISSTNLTSVVKYHDSDGLLALLETINHAGNAQQLLQAIFDCPITRNRLLSQLDRKSLMTLFSHHKPAPFFAHFLCNNYQKPWFKEGFQAFSHIANITKQPMLFHDALSCLNVQTYTDKTVTEATYDAVLSTLITSEPLTVAIWQYFLQASLLTPIQQVDKRLACPTTSFFFKHHCIKLLDNVSNQTNWENNRQYRLLLLMFAHQHHQLLHPHELRYAEKTAWSAEELMLLSRFVRRHNRQPTSLDTNGDIGKKLLAILIFRMANFGQLSLFYRDNKTFDEKMACETIKRSYLNNTAANDYLPVMLSERLLPLINTITAWFNNDTKPKAAIMQELQANQAIIDWQALSSATWDLNSSATTMPLISAYLINYAGPTAPVTQLINDYCNSEAVKKNPALLHHLSTIMSILPNRDISACLFATLEKIVTEKPHYLDKTVFTHLASYHGTQHIKQALSSTQASLYLIKHFGQLKKYSLVKQCCKLLPDYNFPKNGDDTLKHVIIKIDREARLEKKLSKHVGKWYFALLKFIKRYWHYGLEGVKKSSESVLFCDDRSTYLSPCIVPCVITTNVKSGQHITKELSCYKKHMALKKRYEAFISKGDNQSTTNNQTNNHSNQATVLSRDGFFDKSAAKATTIDVNTTPSLVII